MYARMYECGQIAIRTHDQDRHTNGTHDQARTRTGTPAPEKGGTPAKRENKICDCWEIYTQKMKKS